MSTQYHVYHNSGSGPVDYSTVVATTASLTWTSSALTFPGTWKFAVRAFDTVSSLEESNVDALVVLRLDSGGLDVTGIPDAPLALAAHARAAGTIRVDWHATPLDASRKPTGFHVYQGTSGVVSYVTPVATVPFSTATASYTALLTGLTGGTAYTFGVRSYNATGEESNTVTATATADTAATAVVTGLAGSAVA